MAPTLRAINYKVNDVKLRGTKPKTSTHKRTGGGAL